MTDLAKLVVRLEAQTAQFQAQMEKSEQRLQRLESAGTKAFKILGTAAAAFNVINVVNKAIQLGDELDKAATKAGITGRAISELAYVAKQSDVDLGSLSNAIRKMQVNLSQAATGGKAQQEALRALGIELKDIQKLAADRQFEVIGDRINQLKDPADRARAAVELFGKAGAELLPLFEQGARGIRAAREEAQRLGRSFSDEQIKALAEADQSIKKLKGSWEAFATSMTAKVAPALARFFDEWSARMSGDKIGTLKAEIQTLQDSIKSGGGTVLTPFISMGAFGGAPDVEAGIYTLEGQIKKLAELKKKLADLQNQGPGSRGGAQGSNSGSTAVIGFSEADARIKAEEEAEKAREKAERKAEAAAARAAARAGELTEVEVSGVRLREDAYAAYYDDLDAMTQTSAERQMAQFSRIEGALIELRDAGIEAGGISAAEFEKRWQEAFDNILGMDQIDKVYDRLEDRAEGLSQQQEQVYQGTIDFIAQGMLHAFDGTFDNVLKGFQNMLLEMAVKAEAAKIGQYLFGPTGKGGEGTTGFGGFLAGAGKALMGIFGGAEGGAGAASSATGGGFKSFLGGAAKAVASLFGPGMANGGAVSPGIAYPVNENTPKTEWFVPKTAGTIVPHEQMGGGMTVHNNFSIQAPGGSITRQTEQQIAAAAARGIMSASRRNN